MIVGLQVLDELLPKATGREARIEKKRARAEERRAREISPGKVHPLFNLAQAEWDYSYMHAQPNFGECRFMAHLLMAVG